MSIVPVSDRLFRQILFEIGQGFSGDGLGMKIAEDDSVFVIRHLPPHQDLIRVFRGNGLSVVCGVFIVPLERIVEPSEPPYGLQEIHKFVVYLFVRKPFYLFLY